MKSDHENMVLKIHEAKNLNPSGGFTIKDLAINGYDVMKYMDFPQGKCIGQMLNILLDLVVDHPQLNERELLIIIMKESKTKWDRLSTDSLPSN